MDLPPFNLYRLDTESNTPAKFLLYAAFTPANTLDAVLMLDKLEATLPPNELAKLAADAKS